ncbi:hypothetical protein PENDEC_c031G00078 [Penicillium decumbens]|uniref:Uncharacterized protein n=1 Tax=Penicillium decumbens TaxID=69771 RepID=A0A1V6NVI7_PENDC|nr:hypothetical protein PENDEC_c031G00078 [Penicillium decumbens]
MFRSRFVL